MFDGFMSVLVEDLARKTKTHDEAATYRRMYGPDTRLESEPRRAHAFVPRFLRRKTNDPA